MFFSILHNALKHLATSRWNNKVPYICAYKTHFFREKLGQNWGVRLIYELVLKFVFLPEFLQFFLILNYNYRLALNIS